MNVYSKSLTHTQLIAVKLSAHSENDVVILLDEMYLQTQVQFGGKSMIGGDGDLNMFKSILCFMVVR